jgi:hypothetical protein
MKVVISRSRQQRQTQSSAAFAGGQIAMKIVKQASFDYFADLAFPHPVTFTINVTYPITGGTRTEDVTLSANLSALRRRTTARL